MFRLLIALGYGSSTVILGSWKGRHWVATASSLVIQEIHQDHSGVVLGQFSDPCGSLMPRGQGTTRPRTQGLRILNTCMLTWPPTEYKVRRRKVFRFIG